MEPKQAAELGHLIRARRNDLGLSIRQLAEQAEMNFATLSRIEQGQFAAPGPDKLARIAEALAISTTDLFILAGYTGPSDLPSFQPYLRGKYRDMPTAALNELTAAFEKIVRKHGYDPNPVN